MNENIIVLIIVGFFVGLFIFLFIQDWLEDVFFPFLIILIGIACIVVSVFIFFVAPHNNPQNSGIAGLACVLIFAVGAAILISHAIDYFERRR